MKKSVLLSMAILLIFGSTLCLAGPRHPGHFGPPGPRSFMRFADELDLTDKQKEDLEALRDSTRAQIEPLVEQIQALGLADTILTDDINVAVAEGKIEKMVALQCEIAEISANARLESAQILTPDQRKIVLEKLEQRKEMRKGRDNP
jgi:Spy/CpxP family protein refolding chaperone